MKFDVIIGNPPYQKDVGNKQPVEMYSEFVTLADELNSKGINSFILPTRWYNGEAEGMVKMRNIILNNHTTNIVDYLKASDVFEGNLISGGICYYLRDGSSTSDECNIKQILHNNIDEFKCVLNSDIYIRYKLALSILDKVKSFGELTLSGSNKLGLKFKDIDGGAVYSLEKSDTDRYKFINKEGIVSYLSDKNISYPMTEYIDKYKVVTGSMVPGGGTQKSNIYTVINNPKIIGINQVYSNYYMSLGIFDTLEEAHNFCSYIRTKFVRFLIHLTVNSTSINQSKFRFVPMLESYTVKITDESLYKKYRLNEEEIQFIESLIKELL